MGLYGVQTCPSCFIGGPMNDFSLKSIPEASRELASLLVSPYPSHEFKKIPPLNIDVREDKAFASNEWLSLGSVSVFPESTDEAHSEDNEHFPLRHAIDFGSFQWRIPSSDSLHKEIKDLIGITNNDTHIIKAEHSLNALVHAAMRAGLLDPILDADAVIHMPYRKPLTVVADTSAILQGGLDFIARFLCPAARIKIPSVAQMELVNNADRYFSLRRKYSSLIDAKIKPKYKIGLLQEHAKSQGGQRVLLRLELQTDIEIERSKIGADPLRGVFYADTDSEFRSLGLSHVQKSFADRLILETARNHLNHVSPGHPVMLMTSDQGLARMALSEGIPPLFFASPKLSDIVDRTLPGCRFHPFKGELFSVSLTSILWELATTFGISRLQTKHGDSIEFHAIGEELEWHPYCAKDDLLWIRRISGSRNNRSSSIDPDQETENPITVETISPIEPIAKNQNTTITQNADKSHSRVTSYNFDVAKLLELILMLQNNEKLLKTQIKENLGISSDSTLRNYVNFLRSGKIIRCEDICAMSTETTVAMQQAIINRDINSLQEVFMKVPSFHSFIEWIRESRPADKSDATVVNERSFACYSDIADICALGIRIPYNGPVYSTENNPTASEFAKLALETYENNRKGEEYLLTGDWLVRLVCDNAIHPIHARQRLNEAHAAGILDRYTQGSTPDTRYEEYTVNVLGVQKGIPVIQKTGLYHGDFLIDGKASVSLKLVVRE